MHIIFITTSKCIAESARVSHEGSDLGLDALANEEPVKGVIDKRRDMGKLCNVPHEAVSGIEDGLMPRTIC